jgi:CubicO group peptidase (beta-lactamase class C family)
LSRLVFRLLALILFLCPALPAAAVRPSQALTATDLEAFLDGLMPAQLQREDIAGAVVTVVKDGQVLLAKGYGLADVAAKVPVDPGRTLFRPGSISKLFAWTSVMELQEQGRLDLDRDVNDYLDFRVPGPPFTLRQLMTHTAGFEETVKDMMVKDGTRLRPLGVYLKGHIPPRLFAPGTMPAYSNYGAALAGYVVERVSGTPFEAYVEDHIFRPLGMDHSTFRQPLPPSLQPDMSRGYDRGSKPHKPFEFIQVGPAGSLSSTGLDMARFMIAHLQEGRWLDTRILGAATARTMHQRAYAADPRLNGMALGFYEESRNGRRIIGHGGDTLHFHSDLHLLPGEGVGLFVSYNSTGLGEASPRGMLFDAFMDRYFPTPAPSAPVRLASSPRDIAAVSGYYLTSRRCDSTFMYLGTDEVQIHGNGDGTLSMDASRLPGGTERRYQETAPLFFQEVGGERHVAFRRDGRGRLILQTDRPFVSYARAGLLDNPIFDMSSVLFCMATWILTLLGWPLAAWTRRHYGIRLVLEPGARRLRLALRLVCLLDLVFLGGLFTLLSVASSPVALNRVGPWVLALQSMGLLGTLGGLAVVAEAVLVWRRKGTGIWVRLHRLAVALSCVALLVMALSTHILNFNLHF